MLAQVAAAAIGSNPSKLDVDTQKNSKHSVTVLAGCSLKQLGKLL